MHQVSASFLYIVIVPHGTLMMDNFTYIGTLSQTSKVGCCFLLHLLHIITQLYTLQSFNISITFVRQWFKQGGRMLFPSLLALHVNTYQLIRMLSQSLKVSSHLFGRDSGSYLSTLTKKKTELLLIKNVPKCNRWKRGQA